MAAPKLLPALLGGLFIGVLSSLPFISSANICCCLWVVCGGALAALLMQQNTPRPVTNGEGALVGLYAGLVGALVTLVLGTAIQFAMGRGFLDMAEFERAMSEGGREVPPEMRDMLTGMGPVIIIAFVSVIWFVISAMFATLGGLLGALIFRKKTGGPAAGFPPPGGGMPPPTFTPPTFTPPAPAAPVPPTFTPPAPPASPPPAAPSASSWGPPPDPAPRYTPPPAAVPAAPAPPASEEWVGDAPTILIPARGPVLPPVPQAPAPPAPPSGATPPSADREPESH